jgi:uncharacterized membrane protein YgaE (UPF0421/DUF939 family)
LAGSASFFSVEAALLAQHDFDDGHSLAVLGSQVALPSFFSVEVAVVVLVVVVVVVDFAGVCGVCANTIPAIRIMADAKTITFFIVIWFLVFLDTV